MKKPRAQYKPIEIDDKFSKLTVITAVTLLLNQIFITDTLAKVEKIPF